MLTEVGGDPRAAFDRADLLGVLGRAATLLRCRLRNHKNAPALDKIYRWPKLNYRIEFTTLSGWCQHAEGGSCDVRKFKRVRDTIEA